MLGTSNKVRHSAALQDAPGIKKNLPLEVVGTSMTVTLRGGHVLSPPVPLVKCCRYGDSQLETT